MAEREFKREQSRKMMENEEKTSEAWVTDKEERMEMASGDIKEYEGNVTVNPPDAGGKILKNAAGARNHIPGSQNSPNLSMETVRKAEEVIKKGQEKIDVKWPKK
ncbi:hypothetical protein [Methanobacterium sp. ACI-7]|uniref:hypothetical protein n=1 Tax=unclassified Methanobacterium TaxID=2627676 RepID=UPI0039C10D42